MPAADLRPIRPQIQFLSLLTLGGAIAFWESPQQIPFPWSRLLVAAGSLSLAAALLGKPFRILRKDLGEDREETAYQIAPSALLAVFLGLCGALLLLRDSQAPVPLGPGLLILALILVSHGASGGLFFKVLRRK